MLSYGATVELDDDKGYTPLFYASQHGSLSNLLELLNKGNADVGQVSLNGNSAITRAFSHEVIMLLVKYGAEATVIDIKKFLKFHTICSTKVALHNCLSIVTNKLDNEDLLVLDFNHFQKDEATMGLHKAVEESGDKTHILLHPIFHAFLELKWNQVRKHYVFQLFLNLFFAIALTLAGYHFLDLVTCQSCEDSVKEPRFNDHDLCQMPITKLNGTIQCFGLTSKTKILDEFKDKLRIKDGVKWDQSCEMGSESCALIITNETKEMKYLPKYLNHTLKCHKKFLR